MLFLLGGRICTGSSKISEGNSTRSVTGGCLLAKLDLFKDEVDFEKFGFLIELLSKSRPVVFIRDWAPFTLSTSSSNIPTSVSDCCLFNTGKA